MMLDCAQENTDVLFLVTADSDLMPPLALIKLPDFISEPSTCPKPDCRIFLTYGLEMPYTLPKVQLGRHNE